MASKPADPPLTNPWISSDGSPLRGFYWTRIDPKVQPNYWVQRKKVCACRQHSSTQWPVDHAMIEIPPCAFRCPYCTALDTANGRPQPGRVKRHISTAHIRKQGDFYVGLRVSCKCTSKPKEARMLTFAVFVLRLLLIQCCLESQSRGSPVRDPTVRVCTRIVRRSYLASRLKGNIMNNGKLKSQSILEPRTQ
ncbi:uncharacterized protein N7525_003645 [Penicillium rubens]|uniref:uncharacterized protein n=1 Tax=Penicillium rubens TaxID=1108849 RepID=UPI002A5AB903|nr:uncharacterized protein N7525_003645 [Penicillium rubens]KAJ5838457.1 hypothetical protein N7525_003645 [Penicillium rubens]KAJ5866508.1 hypothetical protein N7534_001061 [Penicillium rubens]